jgi:hypothetical protein
MMASVYVMIVGFILAYGYSDKIEFQIIYFTLLILFVITAVSNALGFMSGK